MTTKNHGGFTYTTCTVQGLVEYAGHFVKLTALNENFVAEKVDSKGNVEKTLATIPDLISVVNLETSTCDD